MDTTSGSFAQLAGTALMTGTYEAAGGIIEIEDANIVTNHASILLDGAGSMIVNNAADANALANLAVNGPIASLAIEDGASLTSTGALSNAGDVSIGPNSTLTVGGGGTYTQTGGSTFVFTTTATLIASELDIQGGTLGGSGTIIGDVTVGSAVVEPGASPGSLLIDGNLSLGTGTILDYELGTASDLLLVTGSLVLDGTLNVTAAPGFGPGLFTMFEYEGSLADNGLEFGTLPGGLTYGLEFAPGLVQLRVTVVPEPSDWLLMEMGLVGVGLGLARSRRSAGR